MKVFLTGSSRAAAAAAAVLLASSGIFGAESAFAFAPHKKAHRHCRISPPATTVVAFSRPDSSDAVAEAVRISEKYGADSKEARVAWDIVEEMDSSDTSPATAPGGPVMSPSESRKIDYLVEINALSVLLEETSDALGRMRGLVAQLRELELSDPSLSKLGPGESEGLKRALQEAKAAIEVHGPGSAEAVGAWDKLEACAADDADFECSIDSLGTDRYSAAALKAHHYYDAVVDPELLSESLDALDSIRALSHFVEVEKNRLNKL